MNAYRKGNKYLAFLLAALMALAAVAVVASEESEADGFNGDITDSGFTANRSGTLTIPVTSGTSQSVTVTIKEEGKYVTTQAFNVEEGASNVNVSFSLGEGTHNLDIGLEFEGGDTAAKQYELTVKEDIWANVGTYIAIVIVIIVVAVILVLYMRARPNNKPTTTFTQLEEEKKAAAAKKSSEAKPASKTEKVKYTSSRRK